MTRNSHNNAESRNGMQPVIDFAKSSDIAVIGIGHLTKGTVGKDPLERINGSGAFGALPRPGRTRHCRDRESILYLRSKVRTLTWHGRHLSVLCTGLASAASVSRAEWSKPRAARRSATASHLKRPCRQFPFRSPFGAPLPAAPPCIRQRVFPATLRARHGAPARVRAPHSLRMGLSFIFRYPPDDSRRRRWLARLR